VTFPSIQLELPRWLSEICEPGQVFRSMADRIDLTFTLARTNFERGTGGPFAAAVFDLEGRLLAPGVNLVVPTSIAAAHAEILAISIAGRVVGNFDLGPTELVASTDPCAMCLGAVPWSGVHRLVCGARTEDAAAIGFEEGDRMPDWVQRLEQRGVEVIREVKRAEGAKVLEDYARSGGVIYNGRAAG
jgi:tRNA(Arg) A34 adenosine deaminase TadA